MLKKEVQKRGEERFFLIGKDEQGIKYWLVSPSWDCDWYWGFAYIQTMKRNSCPSIASDTNLHTHFDSMVLKQKDKYHINQILADTVLTDSEAWKLSDLMKSFYTLKEAAEVFYRGSSHYASVDLSLKDPDLYEKINKELLPKLFKEIEKLLTPPKI